MNYKEKFYELLQNMFVGAKIEGQSGYINLMKIKEKYFKKVLLQKLNNKVEEILSKYPKFELELFEKLYTFFSRYFSESGSIHFVNTPYYHQVYDKIYTDKEDVILFWKTKNLYYIKTDRIFNSMEIEIEENNKLFKFFFNTNTLEYKKGNEKKEVIFELNQQETSSKKIVFNVYYSERGKETKIEEILKILKKKEIIISEETLNKAFFKFNQQSEVDYFIHKNAKEFLEEQLKLYIYNYFFKDQLQWTQDRIQQINEFKEIAKLVINYVSVFEDELVKIWNKPRFVLNSNYVITLDRILKNSKETGINIIKKILTHKNFAQQLKEWKDLEIIPEDFNKNEIIIKNSKEETLNEKYKFLPIDTKYFKDLEIEILSLFDDIDNQLDGWLIKSENYQALNTLLNKFKEQIQTIYIDPPFNKEQDADYYYSVKYKDSTWITLLENRLKIAREFLKDTGSIFVRCDYNGNMYVRLLMEEIFGKENFRNEIIINRKRQAIGTPEKFEVESENIYLFSKTERYFRRDLYRPRNITEFKWTGFLKQEERNPPERIFFGKILYPPAGQHFSLVQEKVDKLIKEHYLRLKCKECGAIYYWDEQESKENFINHIFRTREKFKFIDIHPGIKVYGIKSIEFCLNCKNDNWKVEYLTSEDQKITDNWKDIQSYSDTHSFPTENSEILLKRVIESTSNENDLVMDFFLGSGTTTAVAHKLKRRWIGIELGEHFYTITLPRMKKVLAYDKTGISKEKDVKEFYNEKSAGGFFKYFELEQYEDILKKTKYLSSDEAPDLFKEDFNYIFMPDPKLLDAVVVDLKKNNYSFYFSKIYPNIDIAETLSCLLGKKIKKITNDFIIFEDSEKLPLDNLQKYTQQIKNLIWW
ncbi:MAG: site-specific DNA-methyltransferase [Candidatus Aenigmatarchaeota archaeon]